MKSAKTDKKIAGPKKASSIPSKNSRRSQTMEKLETEVELLRKVLDTLPNEIFVKDVNSRIIIDNLAHQHSMGVGSLGETVGKTVFDFYPKETASVLFADEQNLLQSGKYLLQNKPVLQPSFRAE